MNPRNYTPGETRGGRVGCGSVRVGCDEDGKDLPGESGLEPASPMFPFDLPEVIFYFAGLGWPSQA